jgi:hypothetical protein
MKLTVTNRFLRRCRDKLLDARSLLIGEIKAEEVRIESKSTFGEAGQSLDRYFLLLEWIRLVEDALARIPSATFGRCHHCGDCIEARRLSEIPWVRWCSRCRELGGRTGADYVLERNLGSLRRTG